MNRVAWKSAIVSLALALAMGSAPVAAQSSQMEGQIGTRFAREKHDADRGARETMSYFGRCVAGYKGDEIRAFLVEPTAANWTPILAFPNNETRCAVRNTIADYLDFRGALSEGWYLRSFESGPPATFVGGAELAPSQEETAAAIIAADEADRPQVIIDEFARCVAAVNPRGVDALLRTEHGAKDETGAIRALAPSFAPCAFEGQKLSFDEAGLRSALAFALARQAVQSNAS